MVDQQTLASRLSALEGYLARLHAFKQYDRKTFLARSYEVIVDELDDLQAFAKRMARFLES